jgi:hypothetical protein
MTWPDFGMTIRAAEAMVRFISNAGSRHDQSSSPVMISVEHGTDVVASPILRIALEVAGHVGRG